MATATKKRPAAPAKRADKKAIEEALKRLNSSIEAAEAAGKDLRSGVAKGSRELVRDLEQALRHARTNARRVGKSVTEDLQKAVGTEATNGRRRAAPAKRKPAARAARKA